MKLRVSICDRGERERERERERPGEEKADVMSCNWTSSLLISNKGTIFETPSCSFFATGRSKSKSGEKKIEKIALDALFDSQEKKELNGNLRSSKSIYDITKGLHECILFV